MFKKFWEILKDQKGSLNLGTAVATAVLDKKAAEERGAMPSVYSFEWPGTSGLQKGLSTNLGTGLDTLNKYLYENPGYNLTQPEVEKATQDTILGKLKNLPTTQDYSAKIEAAKASQIANEKTAAEKQLADEREMYNRLGLSSSTPFMSRAGELGQESIGRQNDINSNMDIYGLNYGLQADQLVNDIAAQWTGLGGVLGSQQRDYQQYTQQMTQADKQNLYNTILGYLNKGAVSPETGYQAALAEWGQPNDFDRASSIWAQQGVI
jgi:hypothetical protein